LLKLFRDDSRRIAMPLVLVQVLVFSCGVAMLLVPKLCPRLVATPVKQIPSLRYGMTTKGAVLR
jgi:hypothetical protein